MAISFLKRCEAQEEVTIHDKSCQQESIVLEKEKTYGVFRSRYTRSIKRTTPTFSMGCMLCRVFTEERALGLSAENINTFEL